MKRCELCKSRARIHCDSDKASLCWTCDAKVHSANFLVARHSRSLLCQICQSLTPWYASGKKLWPSTASICGRCVVEGISDDDEICTDGDDECDGSEYRDEIQFEDSVDENGNHVVPRSSLPPQPAASSSGSDGDLMMKRKRRNVSDLNSEDELDRSSAQINHHMTSSPMREPPIGEKTTSFHSMLSSSEATVRNVKRIRRNINSGEYMAAPVHETNKSTRTVDFDLNALP